MSLFDASKAANRRGVQPLAGSVASRYSGRSCWHFGLCDIPHLLQEYPGSRIKIGLVGPLPWGSGGYDKGKAPVNGYM